MRTEADRQDRELAGGCLLFSLTALGVYALASWPWFVWGGLHTADGFVRCALVGLVPATLLGLGASWRGGVAGGTGWVAGALTFGLFVSLRVRQLDLAGQVRQSPPLEYPLAWGWLLALAYTVLAATLAYAVQQSE